MPLSMRQDRFVSEYLVDLNGTQAAIRTGYSAKTARAQAARLLTKADVSRAVAEAYAEQSRKLDVTVERINQELACIGFVNIETRTKVRPFDKVKALQTLSNHHWRLLQLQARSDQPARSRATVTPDDLDELFAEMTADERAVMRRVLERRLVRPPDLSMLDDAELLLLDRVHAKMRGESSTLSPSDRTEIERYLRSLLDEARAVARTADRESVQ